MSACICDELSLQRLYLDDTTIETLYFGGGTPSILSLEDLQDILNAVQKSFHIDKNPEITIEANPEDLTLEKLTSLKSMGINRLSIGVQSFDDVVLKFLNRSHNGRLAKQSITNARLAGFNNLNVDLIYAIPDRSIEKLKTDVSTLIELCPEHISAYSLTIEEKTVFGKRASTGKIAPVAEEENAAQFEFILNCFSQAGYDHYEISNYSRPGFESRHNSNYWKQKKYLGVGPSAHSFNGINRQFNVSNNHTYIRSIQDKKIPATVELLSREDHINEYLLTSLRTKWGCDLNYLIEHHQYNLIKSQEAQIKTCIQSGLMQLKGSTLFLTHRGKMHADKLSSDLFLIT